MTETTKRIKKPWYKTWWIWVIIVVALIIIGTINQATGNTADGDSDTPSETTAAEAAVPDVVELDGAAARDILIGLGFNVEFDAGTETVIKASNWTVDAQNPPSGEQVDVGTTVTLTVAKPEKTQAPADNTLDEVTAAQHLALAWEDRMTYGGTVHWIVDRITTVNEDGTFTFKIGATIENAYGNKSGATIEGDVGGTTAAPEILDSIMYTDTGEVINYHG